jgi:hypothetical protein
MDEKKNRFYNIQQNRTVVSRRQKTNNISQTGADIQLIES